uniref:Uncharacterized protein n=1 Tax=viral metagenome TaxID=1070528 RepID=A0A6H1ZVN1_9ZZZZ
MAHKHFVLANYVPLLEGETPDDLMARVVADIAGRMGIGVVEALGLMTSLEKKGIVIMEEAPGGASIYVREDVALMFPLQEEAVHV